MSDLLFKDDDISILCSIESDSEHSNEKSDNQNFIGFNADITNQLIDQASGSSADFHFKMKQSIENFSKVIDQMEVMVKDKDLDSELVVQIDNMKDQLDVLLENYEEEIFMIFYKYAFKEEDGVKGETPEKEAMLTPKKLILSIKKPIKKSRASFFNNSPTMDLLSDSPVAAVKDISQSFHHSLILRSVKKKKRLTMMIPGAMATGLMSPYRENDYSSGIGRNAALLKRRRSHHPLASISAATDDATTTAASAVSEPAAPDNLSKELFGSGSANTSVDAKQDQQRTNRDSEIVQLKKDIEHLNFELVTQKEENTLLCNNDKIMKSRLHDLTLQREKLESDLKIFEEKSKEFQQQISSELSNSSTLKKELEFTKSEVKNLTIAKDVHTKKILELNLLNDTANTELFSLDQKTKISMEQTRVECQLENASMVESMASMTTEIDNLRTQNEALKRDISEKTASLQEEAVSISNNVEAIQSENESLKIELKDKNSILLENSDKLTAEINAMRSENELKISNFQEKIALMDQESIMIFSENESLKKDLEDKNNILLESSEKLNAEISFIRSEKELQITELQKKITLMDQESIMIFSENESLKKEIEEKNTTLTDNSEKLTTEIHSIRSENELQILELQEKIKLMDQEATTIFVENESLKKDLEDKNNILLDSSQKLNAEISSVRNEKELQLTELREKIALMDQEATTIFTENESLKKEIEDKDTILSDKSEKLTAEIHTIRSENEIQISQLHEKISLMDQEATSIFTENESLKKEIEDKDTILSDKSEKLTAEIHTIRSENEIQISQLQEKIALMDQEATTIFTENESLKKEIEDKDTILSDKSEKLTAEIHTIRSENEIQISQLQEKIALMDQEATAIFVENESLKKEIEDKDTILSDKSEKLSAEIHTIRSENEIQISQLQEKIALMDQEATAIFTENELLKKDLEDKNNTFIGIKETAERYTSLKSEYESMQALQLESTSEIDSYKIKINELENCLLEKNNNLDVSKREIDELVVYKAQHLDLQLKEQRLSQDNEKISHELQELGNDLIRCKTCIDNQAQEINAFNEAKSSNEIVISDLREKIADQSNHIDELNFQAIDKQQSYNLLIAHKQQLDEQVQHCELVIQQLELNLQDRAEEIKNLTFTLEELKCHQSENGVNKLGLDDVLYVQQSSQTVNPSESALDRDTQTDVPAMFDSSIQCITDSLSVQCQVDPPITYARASQCEPFAVAVDVSCQSECAQVCNTSSQSEEPTFENVTAARDICDRLNEVEASWTSNRRSLITCLDGMRAVCKLEGGGGIKAIEGVIDQQLEVEGADKQEQEMEDNPTLLQQLQLAQQDIETKLLQTHIERSKVELEKNNLTTSLNTLTFDFDVVKLKYDQDVKLHKMKLKSLQEIINALEKDVSREKENNAVKDETICEFKASLLKESQDNKAMSLKFDEMNNDKESLVRDINTLTDLNNELNKSKANQLLELENVQLDQTELKNQLDQYKLTLDAVQMNNDKQLIEIGELKDNKEKLNTQIADLDITIINLNIDFESFKNKCEDLKDQVKQLEEKESDLELMVVNLETKMEEKQIEIDEMNESRQLMKDNEAKTTCTINQLKMDIEDKESQCDTIKIECETKFKQSLSELQSKYDNQCTLYTEIKEARDTMACEANTLNTLIEQLQFKVDEQTNMLGDNDAAAESLNQKFADSQRDVENLKTESENKTSKIEMLQNEKISLETKCQDLNSAIKDLKKNIQSKEQELDEVKEARTAMAEENNSLIQQVNDLKFKIDDQQNKLNEMTKSKATLDDNQVKSETTINKLKEEIEKKTLEFTNVQESQKGIQEKCEEYSLLIITLKSELNKIKSEDEDMNKENTSSFAIEEDVVFYETAKCEDKVIPKSALGDSSEDSGDKEDKLDNEDCKTSAQETSVANKKCTPASINLFKDDSKDDILKDLDNDNDDNLGDTTMTLRNRRPRAASLVNNKKPKKMKRKFTSKSVKSVSEESEYNLQQTTQIEDKLEDKSEIRDVQSEINLSDNFVDKSVASKTRQSRKRRSNDKKGDEENKLMKSDPIIDTTIMSDVNLNIIPEAPKKKIVEANLRLKENTCQFPTFDDSLSKDAKKKGAKKMIRVTKKSTKTTVADEKTNTTDENKDCTIQ